MWCVCVMILIELIDFIEQNNQTPPPGPHPPTPKKQPKTHTAPGSGAETPPRTAAPPPTAAGPATASAPAPQRQRLLLWPLSSSSLVLLVLLRWARGRRLLMGAQ